MKRRICMIVLFALPFVAVGHGQDWKQIGPAPIQGQGFSNVPYASASGSVTGIVIDPSGKRDSTIYIATSAGGVWKLANESPSWASKSNGMPILFMGAIALDPSHSSTLYAGIGGPWCCFSGGGIYRSTDGADHWKLLNPNGIFTNLNIAAIVLPESGTLLVATNSGLFKSVDSGDNFGNNSPKFDNGNPIAVATPQGSVTNGNISDLMLDTATRTTVYVAIDNAGVYKSTDSGTSFPSSGKLFSQASFPPLIKGTGDVFIKIAQSTRPNNKTMYAFLCAGTTVSGEPCALLKSVTGGSSWNQLSLTGIKINQQDYDQIVGVDPQDANRVYIGLRQLYYASDGGAGGFSSANQIDQNGAHTDDHVITFSPASHFTGPPPTQFFLGTDGGVAGTAVGGSAPGSEWYFLNEGLSTALLYGMDMGRGSNGNNVYSYGAAQDNGTFVRTPGLPGGGIRWQFQCCGDSGSVAVDPANPLHAITLNDGGLTCTTNAQNWSPCGNLPPNTPGFGLVSFDPSGGVAYAATGSQLFQSQNNAQTFVPIHTFPQSISAISQIKGKQNLLWIGQSDGTIQWTNNALQGPAASWTKVVVNGAPSGQGVTGIAIDPKDSSTVVAVYPGFSGSADPPQHVFLTTDSGTKWDNIGGKPGGGDNNIPDLPAFAVVILPTTKPHTIIVGSDGGVFQTTDTGKTWQLLGTGFPPVQVTGLALDYAAKPFVLRASTFGRSVFELQGSCPLCPPAAQCKMTGCIGDISWSYSLTCTGDGVGIVYNGGCSDTSGEPRSCYAGFNGSSTAQASWGGAIGPPTWLSAGAQGSPTVCTTNNTGEQTCKVFNSGNLPACPPQSGGPTLPPPRCGQGETYCMKYSPPMCVPSQDCTYIRNLPN
jgi:photosystem II stability/assembly factor-like uncharacterized protein